MGWQLWTSPITGYRRKGTRMRDLRKLFEIGITADSIQEPLKCCLYGEPALHVKSELMRLDFDVAGILRSKDEPILEFIRRKSLKSGTCEQVAETITARDIISESTPLIETLNGLRMRDYYFIQNGTHTSGIVTRADLQKPPVRILVFGIISLLEMHLTYLLRMYFPEETWQALLKPARVKKAESLLQQRKQRNEVIDLSDCLQFSDKRSVVLKSKKILEHLGFKSKKEAETLLKRIEKVRDKLAHAQDIVSGTTWEDLIETVGKVELILQRSDDMVEKQITKVGQD